MKTRLPLCSCSYIYMDLNKRVLILENEWDDNSSHLCDWHRWTSRLDIAIRHNLFFNKNMIWYICGTTKNRVVSLCKQSISPGILNSKKRQKASSNYDGCATYSRYWGEDRLNCLQLLIPETTFCVKGNNVCISKQWVLLVCG